MAKERKLIVYLNDDNKIQTLLAIVEEITSQFVVVKTETNRIMIPVPRVLKIKENLETRDD